MLMRLSHRNQLDLLLLNRGAAVATAAAVALIGLGACGGRGSDGDASGSSASARVPCVDDDPGEAATYANPDVAIGRDPRKPIGSEHKAYRSGDTLPWFAKTPLYVRGNGEVVVRLPEGLGDDVEILGWGTNDGEGREVVLVNPTAACRGVWTAYTGGLMFRGRHCVRLRIEGPGDADGSVLVGLRRDCSARA
jgi:hypothetical protein